MAKAKCPKGYREYKKTDNLEVLHAQGKYGDLCQCGHLRTEHIGLGNGGSCSECDCPKFTWDRWVVKE